MFDFHTYLRRLTRANLSARAGGYVAASCSGIESLQGVVDELQSAEGLVLSDDTATGQTVREGGGGWFCRRTFTVFLLRRHTFQDEGARRAAMDEVREMARQFQSRFLKDRDALSAALVFLRVEQMPLTEIPGYFAHGCAGLYFMVTVEEPVSLVYNADEWDDSADTFTAAFDRTFA